MNLSWEVQVRQSLHSAKECCKKFSRLNQPVIIDSKAKFSISRCSLGRILNQVKKHRLNQTKPNEPSIYHLEMGSTKGKMYADLTSTPKSRAVVLIKNPQLVKSMSDTIKCEEVGQENAISIEADTRKTKVSGKNKPSLPR